MTALRALGPQKTNSHGSQGPSSTSPTYHQVTFFYFKLHYAASSFITVIDLSFGIMIYLNLLLHILVLILLCFHCQAAQGGHLISSIRKHGDGRQSTSNVKFCTGGFDAGICPRRNGLSYKHTRVSHRKSSILTGWMSRYLASCHSLQSFGGVGYIIWICEYTIMSHVISLCNMRSKTVIKYYATASF